MGVPGWVLRRSRGRIGVVFSITWQWQPACDGRDTAMKHISSVLSRDNLYLAGVIVVAACTWGVMLYLAAGAY